MDSPDGYPPEYHAAIRNALTQRYDFLMDAYNVMAQRTFRWKEGTTEAQKTERLNKLASEARICKELLSKDFK